MDIPAFTRGSWSFIAALAMLLFPVVYSPSAPAAPVLGWEPASVSSSRRESTESPVSPEQATPSTFVRRPRLPDAKDVIYTNYALCAK